MRAQRVSSVQCSLRRREASWRENDRKRWVLERVTSKNHLVHKRLNYTTNNCFLTNNCQENAFKMFWGLIMEPNRRYSQTVEKSFHVSMASLDSSTADDKIVQVMLNYDDLNYLLCTLQKGQTWQVPLDLNFEEGTKIAFTSNGCGHVHLTGYLAPEDNLDLDDMEEASEEEEDEEIPQLISAPPKRKAQESPKDAKNAKRSKAAMKQEVSSDEDDDADSDEEDEDSPKINGAANEEDDSDDSEEDDEEDEDEDSSEEEEEEKVEVKPQLKKQKQQKEQQQLTKKEKQKLANGKDAKQEQTSQQQKKGKPEQQQQQKKSKAEHQQQQQAQKKRTVDGGVQVEDVKVGNGAPAKSGKFVSVYYVGRLTNGKKFDSTTQGDGFKFRLGKGEVIKGWDAGIAGMKIGGKRRITIPPGMAYGAKGSPPVIPGNSTLIFEVELKNVH